MGKKAEGFVVIVSEDGDVYAKAVLGYLEEGYSLLASGRTSGIAGSDHSYGNEPEWWATMVKQ